MARTRRKTRIRTERETRTRTGEAPRGGAAEAAAVAVATEEIRRRRALPVGAVIVTATREEPAETRTPPVKKAEAGLLQGVQIGQSPLCRPEEETNLAQSSLGSSVAPAATLAGRGMVLSTAAFLDLAAPLGKMPVEGLLEPGRHSEVPAQGCTRLAGEGLVARMSFADLAGPLPRQEHTAR